MLDVNDKGTDSVADVADLDILDVTSWASFEETYWWLMSNPSEYQTLIIDTISQLQQFAIADIVSAPKDNKAPGDWGTVSKQQWGEISSRLKQWITLLRDLPMEVVFLAQDRAFDLEEDANGETLIDPEIGPQVLPSVAKHLNSAVNVIGNTFIRGRIEHVPVKTKAGIKKKKEVQVIEYGLRLGPHPIYTTKVRKPRPFPVPSFIINPTYQDILNILKGASHGA